jgi:succinate dehydrogenase/fumarate reductase flavoprotein subunit
MPYDLVTIGGGFSGLVSAARAAELGLKVAVLEARTEDRYPCSSRYTTGVSNVMGLAILAHPDVLYQAIIDGSGGTANPALARAVADNGRRAIDWLPAQGARFITRALQKDQPGQKVLAPPRRLIAGLDWEGRGGDVVMRQLEQNLMKRGGVVQRGRQVTQLVVENGACTGVVARHNGASVRIDARAVVIADGGFAANPQTVAQYITARADRVLARVGPGANGDGIRLAEAAGAAIGGFGAFYGHVHHRAAMQNPKLWPYPHLDAVAEVALLIGPDGRRFTDEGLGGVCQANAIARLADPLSAYLIMDDAMWQAEPKLTTTVAANSAMVTAGGALISAPDIETLAAKIGISSSALAETVRAHNDAVAADDFARLAIPRSVKKQRPMAFAVPPYHAVPLCAGITGTMGGVVIDAQARAQRRDGGVFPGLYAVGTPVAGLEGGPRAGYVGGLSKAFILGLLAAEDAANVNAARR